MGELKLSTKDSLYEPIIVKINDDPYKCRKFTTDVMDKHLDFEVAMGKAGEKSESKVINKLVFEQVHYLFGIDKELLKKLDSRELFDIIGMVEREISMKKKEPKTEKEKKEKNVPTPGDKPSP